MWKLLTKMEMFKINSRCDAHNPKPSPDMKCSVIIKQRQQDGYIAALIAQGVCSSKHTTLLSFSELLHRAILKYVMRVDLVEMLLKITRECENLGWRTQGTYWSQCNYLGQPVVSHSWWALKCARSIIRHRPMWPQNLKEVIFVKNTAAKSLTVD